MENGGDNPSQATPTVPWLAIILVFLGWLSVMLPWNTVTPLLPMIEEEYHISHAMSSWLMSGYSLTYSLIQVPVGLISDRYGKKYLLVMSMLGSSLMTFLTLFAHNFAIIVVLRALAGFFSGFWYSPSTALLVESTHEKHEGKAVGLSVTGFPISSILLFVIVWWFGDKGWDWRMFFALSSIPGFLCSLLLTIFIREERVQDQTSRIKEKRWRKSLSDLVQVSAFSWLLLVSFFQWFLSYTLFTFLPTYYIIERSLSVSEVSSLFVINSVAMILSGPVAGYLHDKLGFAKPLILSMVFMSLTAFLIPIVSMGAPTITIIAIWGIIGLLPGPIISVLTSQISPLNLQGLSLGMMEFVGFLGATIGPLFFGYIIDQAGFNTYFTLLIIIHLIVALLIFGFKKELNNKKNR
jgi:predicted MFS family arabinose efflux permease